jgi:putative polyhydroxyalkanoate system protein
MADIHIERAHGMSLAQARRNAQTWADKASQKFDLQCSYEAGQAADLLTFKRSGVSGTLTVTGELFELQAKLGFMLGAFKERIEAEIVKSLDSLIAAESQAQSRSSRAA